jgi:hypothetical protein
VTGYRLCQFCGCPIKHGNTCATCSKIRGNMKASRQLLGDKQWVDNVIKIMESVAYSQPPAPFGKNIDPRNYTQPQRFYMIQQIIKNHRSEADKRYSTALRATDAYGAGYAAGVIELCTVLANFIERSAR